MNRYMRIRHYNPSSKSFDILFPQGVTGNVLRKDGGNVLEDDLLRYDHHLASKQAHMNSAVSTGTNRELRVYIRDAVLTDCFPLLLTLHTNLECEPTLSFNGSEPAHIVSGNGDNIPGGQEEGSIIFLVWSESIQRWILMSSDTYSDVTKVLLPVESEYVHVASRTGEKTIVIPKFDKNSDKITINYGQTILRSGIDYSFQLRSVNTIDLIGFELAEGDMLYCTITKYIATAKRGTLKYDIETNEYPVTIDTDHTTTILLPEEAHNAHSVIVNYGQTILRNTYDYDYSEDGKSITLKNMELNSGEILTFTVTRFIESNAELVPNNWGATGNYRYSMNVIHTEFTATEDTTVIPVPNFNYKRDDIWPIYQNKLLIYDVDYTIDEIGQLVLLKMVLKANDTLFFTILQGAMFDVPNFNVIRATGTSGQHILLDMSYSVLSDYYTLLVQLKYDLETNPTIKTIDGPAEPVCDCFGNLILGGYKAGAYLWLAYNYDKHCWYSLGHGQLDITSLMPSYKTRMGDANFLGQSKTTYNGIQYHEVVIEHGLGKKPERIDVQPIEPPTVKEDGTVTSIGDVWCYADEKNLYVGNSGESTSKFHWVVSNEDDSADLKSYIDKQIQELKDQPGKFDTKFVVYTADADDTTDIIIDGFNGLVDKLFVNFGQTVLRENVDYQITPEGIRLISFKLAAGDIIQFMIIIQSDDQIE